MYRIPEAGLVAAVQIRRRRPVKELSSVHKFMPVSGLHTCTARLDY